MIYLQNDLDDLDDLSGDHLNDLSGDNLDDSDYLSVNDIPRSR